LKNTLLVLCIALNIISLPTLAQQSKHPSSFLNDQLAQQLKNVTQALSDPELVKAKARLYRSQYDALIETGFSKDEALKIVISLASSDKD
jgi:chaperonin cofactor prefoldin